MYHASVTELYAAFNDGMRTDADFLRVENHVLGNNGGGVDPGHKINGRRTKKANDLREG